MPESDTGDEKQIREQRFVIDSFHSGIDNPVIHFGRNTPFAYGPRGLLVYQ